MSSSLSNPPAILPRVPPHSTEAEQSVIGALMLDNRAWDRVIDFVVEEDFYKTEHRYIYRAIATLAERSHPFDVLTISEVLKSLNLIDKIGGEAYLFELAQNTPTAANVAAYAEIVRDRSVLRQLMGTATDIADRIFNPDGRDVKEMLDDAERQIYQIADQNIRGSGPIQINKLLSKAVDRIDYLSQHDGQLTGLSTGFSDFDHYTSGMQPGDLIIVAGRPSMGKTVLGMNIAEHAAIRGEKPVLVFSMEMPAEQLTMRMISSLGRIDQHKVRTGRLTDDDWPRITSAVSVLSEAKMYIDDTPSMSPSEVRSRARRLSREHNGLSLIVLDYLQLMRVPGTRENRSLEVSEISRSLKAIAKELTPS